MTELTDELIEATSEFGIAYEVAKEAEKESKAAQTTFYEVADKALSQRRLPRKTIKLDFTKDEEADKHIATYYPEWRVVSYAPEEGKVLIEKDPAKMKYVFINPADGKIYQRTTQDKGQAYIDVERLRDEDPKLWDEVSHWDPTIYKIVESAIIWSFPDGERPSKEELAKGVEAWFEALHPTEYRVLKPSVAWSQSQTGRLQKYMVPAGITVKIVPPRAATEEELAADEI